MNRERQANELGLITADTASVEQACTAGGLAEHDWRIRTYERYGKPHDSYVCVWCSVVACGDVGQPDPCWRAYHHQGDHRSRYGATWSIGGARPGLAYVP